MAKTKVSTTTLEKVIQGTQSRVFLFCPKCKAEWSADSEDYWAAKEETVMKCQCGTQLVLAKKVEFIVLEQDKPVTAKDLPSLFKTRKEVTQHGG